MLTDKDIKKLSSVLATKSEFKTVKKDILGLKSEMSRGFSLMATKSELKEVKEEVIGLRESVQGLLVAVDKLAKVISDLNLEYAAITHQLRRHEEWIKQIAKKSGVSLQD